VKPKRGSGAGASRTGAISLRKEEKLAALKRVEYHPPALAPDSLSPCGSEVPPEPNGTPRVPCNAEIRKELLLCEKL